MNILVVSNGYPSEKYGMLGLFAFDQARALSRAGHRVILASVDLRSIRRRRRMGFYRTAIDGVEIYNESLCAGRVPMAVHNRLSVFALDRIFRKIVSDGIKIDIIHAHFYDMAYCAAKISEKYGVPFLVTEHYSGFLSGKKEILDRILPSAKYAYEKADRLLAVGKALRDSILQYTGVDSTLVPNMVDIGIFRSALRERRSSGDGLVRFVSVGRLCAQKDMAFLISAFAEAHRALPCIHLEIIGDGEMKVELQAQIVSEGLENVVKLSGFLPRDIIASRFSQSDCFILLSSFETFGVAYIEALAAGLPVIATACGGPENFLTPEYGIMVERHDMKQSVEAILHMSRNFSEYDGAEISDKISRCFSPEALAQRLTSIYNDVLAESAAGSEGSGRDK